MDGRAAADHHRFSLIAQASSSAMRLPIIPKKTVQLKSFAIEESPLDSDVIARPKRAETIDIRPASVVGMRNEDLFSGSYQKFCV